MPSPQVQRLLERGVSMPLPEGVHVGEDVDPRRIASRGVVIHPGCRVTGASTCLLEGVQLGEEAPATVADCQVGPDVALKGGFFKEAVFLRGSSMGSGAHVRPGTILEEQASGAHCVGLKQTILFPFVTLGSLVNFCDCLMAGGTDRKNHSEVGSSYIHFNFTPQQDKATPSIMGDVPRGVMLNQAPIFLGGQGGMVGPCRIEYGTVIAAGTVWRKDVDKPGLLVCDRASGRSAAPFALGLYKGVKRIAHNNVAYMADLLALGLWCTHVRPLFVQGALETALHQGLVEKWAMVMEERLTRFSGFCAKLTASLALLAQHSGDKAPAQLMEQKRELIQHGPEMTACLEKWRGALTQTHGGDAFLEDVAKAAKRHGPDYLAAIKGLSQDQAAQGAAWLGDFARKIKDETLSLAPSCQ